MIKFSLACENGHEFESWFSDGEAYETQARRGLVTCPHCDSRQVRKALMAPNVVSGRRHEAAEHVQVALIDEKQKALRAALAEMRAKIEANTVDVGTKFPDVARAIHAGDEPDRPIRGQATLAEARALVEEGVGVMPIPALPEEAN